MYKYIILCFKNLNTLEKQFSGENNVERPAVLPVVSLTVFILPEIYLPSWQKVKADLL